MNMYWVYDLPNWLFGALTIGVAEAIGLSGLYATRNFVRRIHAGDAAYNGIVGWYLSAVCVFYGITLGLLAVGTWQAYSSVESKAGEEAAAIGALYRDVSSLPQPERDELQADLQQYTRQVIDVAWPLQRRGIIPQSDGAALGVLQGHLFSFEPRNEGQKQLHAETYRAFNQIAELRGRRLQSVREGLPACLWTIVLLGAFLNLAVTWFFYLETQAAHFWMTVLFAALLGLLIFLLAALDNPFRGDVSISSESFELLYQRLMKSGT
jgi:Protein of unknown function (DUF4239)